MRSEFRSNPSQRSTLARPVAGRDAKGRICGSAPLYLTAEQEQIIRREWEAGTTAMECARLAGVPCGRIRERLKDQLRDLPRRGRGTGGQKRGGLPSPEEIAAEAARLRRSWPPERWLGWNPEDPRQFADDQGDAPLDK